MRRRKGKPVLNIVPEVALGGGVACLVALGVANILADRGFPLPTGKRIGCVDGLRGFLALGVVVHHFALWIITTRFHEEWKTVPINFLNELGAASVALFFMTTGFVFYPRILKGFNECSWHTIYIHRVFRIIPIIAFSVGIITLIIYARKGVGDLSHYPRNALMWLIARGEPPLLGEPESWKLNAGVLWSLRFEWIFYLLILPACAFVMDVLRRNKMPTYIVPVLFMSGAFAAQLAHFHSPTFRYLPLFCIGMLAFEAQGNENLSRFLRSRLAAAMASFSLIFGMIFFNTPYEIALPFFAFFFVCVACGNNFGGILESRAALVLGECSYGIYLMHGIVLSVIFTEFSGYLDMIPVLVLPVLLPFVFCVVVLITSFTYLWVEKPFIGFGRDVSRYVNEFIGMIRGYSFRN